MIMKVSSIILGMKAAILYSIGKTIYIYFIASYSILTWSFYLIEPIEDEDSFEDDAYSKFLEETDIGKLYNQVHIEWLYANSICFY